MSPSPSTPYEETPASTAVNSPRHSRPGSKEGPSTNESPKTSSNVFVVTLCLFQSLAGLLFGWEQGVISGVILLPDYIERFGIPDVADPIGYSMPTQRQSLITAIMALGCFSGAMSAGVMSEKIGKKKGNFVALTIFIAGIAIEISSERQWVQIIFGRIIAGVGIGMTSMITPLFQAEASPPHLRGTLTGTYQLAVTLGIFLANCTNTGMKKYAGSISWRLPIGIQLLWALLFIAGTSMMPESPRYFIAKGNREQALSNLARLRGRSEDDEILLKEFNDIDRKLQHEAEQGDSSLWECFSTKDRMLLRTMIGVGVQTGQQWSGCNFFFSYGTKFFASSGIADSYVTQMILSAVNVAATFPGLWAVERRGRREVLLAGSVVMFIGLVVTGSVATALPGQEVSGKVLIAFSCLFIAAFAATWGPLAWSVSSESFPMRLAPKCIALATAANWFWNFVIAIITPYLTDAGYGNLQAKICFLWAGTVAFFGFFVWYFVPETAGLTLIQIDELYLSKIPAWRSANWKPFGEKAERSEKHIIPEGKTGRHSAQVSHSENVENGHVVDK